MISVTTLHPCLCSIQPMRCYFVRGGHTEGYVPLQQGSDEALIAQALTEFLKADRDRVDGFEVWRKERCLYRWPPKPSEPWPSS